jgi:manganese/iron transport system permease protein
LFLLALAFASLASVSGLYASYYWSVSSGGAIVLASTTLFAIVWTYNLALQKWLSRNIDSETTDNPSNGL